MPEWDEPDPAAERARLMRDLGAARSLLEVLPAGSRDQAMVRATIEALTEHLRELTPQAPGRQPQDRSERMSRDRGAAD
jgi:hypothetical protein